MCLNGYRGEETYIDGNVFCGGLEEFAAYLENNAYKPPTDEEAKSG